MTTPVERMAHLARMEPDEIAQFFREQGIKGYPESTEMCPVACYVKARVGNLSWRDPLPVSVIDFICQFDAGVYPDLVFDPSPNTT